MAGAGHIGLDEISAAAGAADRLQVAVLQAGRSGPVAQGVQGQDRRGDAAGGGEIGLHPGDRPGIGVDAGRAGEGDQVGGQIETGGAVERLDLGAPARAVQLARVIDAVVP